eukprot:CAMPEP_0177668334 /NCGR_PEP_ID=MMETSP0447-20121125/22701_1 /TAXON_ID=0 /ORGANISM="Stygamoeba regulata, Strain BSH-02190019" /LENGTH=367 /DNA_ID=CAMNT_0019174825 /DNA_START=1 /DNA_END=1101 /DNA_ORIENTATION=+
MRFKRRGMREMLSLRHALLAAVLLAAALSAYLVWARTRTGASAASQPRACRCTADTDLPFPLKTRANITLQLFLHPPPDIPSDTVRATGRWVDCDDIIDNVESLHTPRAVVVEVGANIGLCSMQLGALGHRVLAVEPNPRNAEKLRKSIKRNAQLKGEVTLVEAAAWNSKGHRDIQMETTNFGNSIVIGGDEKLQTVKSTKEVAQYQTEQVRLTRLDDIVLPGVAIDVLKIDAQGAELFVLEGAEAILSQATRPRMIIFELAPAWLALFQVAPLDLVRKVHGLGYALHLPNSVPFPPGDWEDYIARLVQHGLFVDVVGRRAVPPVRTIAQQVLDASQWRGQLMLALRGDARGGTAGPYIVALLHLTS